MIVAPDVEVHRSRLVYVRRTILRVMTNGGKLRDMTRATPRRVARASDDRTASCNRRGSEDRRRGADSGAQDSQGASRGLTARSSIGNLFVDGLPKEPSVPGARAALSVRGAGGVGQRMGILIRAWDDGFGDRFANSRVASAGRGTLGQLPFQKGPQNFPSADRLACQQAFNPPVWGSPWLKSGTALLHHRYTVPGTGERERACWRPT